LTRTGEPTTGATGVVGLAASGVAMIAVCYGLARFAYGLFVPVFGSEFGLDATVAGAIASGSYAAYCVAVVVATVATSRWGPRAVAVAAGLTAAVGTGLVAVAPDLGVLAAGVLIGGSSTGLASPPLAEAVSRSVPADRADRVQTVINAGTGLGVVVSGPVALLVSGDWRWAWAAFCVLAVLVTIAAAVTVPGRRHARPPAAGRGIAAGDRPSPRWRRPGLVRLLLAAAALGLGSSAVWVFARDVVIAAGGVSPATATLMWIVLGAAGMLAVLTGDLVGRTGLGRAWGGGMLLVAAATATIGLVPGSLPAIFCAAAVFGGAYIALSGVLLLWGTRLYPDAPAFGVGAPFLLLALGQAIAAPVIGLLSDVATSAVAFGAAALLTVLGALPRPHAPATPVGAASAVTC
jgi:predicted MFS family arabinose efflux permease